MDMILDILRKYLPVGVKVWVFGSRANWNTRDSSDLDLALEGDSALDYGVMVALETAFEQSGIPYKVDVIDLSQVTDGFRRIVKVRRILLPLNEVQTSGDDQWKQTTVEEFSPFTYGKSLPVHARNTMGQIPVFGSNGIIGYHDSALTDGPTVIIGRKGTVGSIHYSDVPCWPIDTTFFFTDQDVELIKFKYYALGTLSLDNMNTRSAAHAQKLRVPGEREQRRIVHILRTLDDKIELNRRMNQTLEEMARTLFKSWFVDFDPVCSKMDGRWKRGESLLGLPAEYYDMFPDRLVDSELGEIPEGWVVKALDEIATFLNGLALQKYPANGGPSLPVIKIAQLRAGNTHKANVASRNIPKQYQIHDGDVLFSWSGSLVLDIWTGGEGALNQHLFKVESVDYPKWLYYHSIRRHLAGFRDIASDKATTMGHIQRHHIHEAKISIPNNLTLKLMGRHMKPLLDRNQSIRIESRTLVTQRNTLLPKLMSGEIRVRKFTEEVS